MRTRILALLLLPFLGTACVMTSTETRTWGDPYGQAWERRGRVEQIRETVQRTEGNPAGGAVVGALIGGLIGSTVGGYTHYDRWGYAHQHANPAGALVGAAGGAAVGAAVSQGGSERRFYEVWVRFDDGAVQPFTYEGGSPFRPGDVVVLTDRGLDHARY